MKNTPILAFILCISLLLTACGGGGSDSEIIPSEGANVGATLANDEWEVKLVDPPYKSKEVGEGTEVTGRASEFGDIGTYIADGAFLVVPVELTNKAGEMLMLGGKLFKVVDGAGNEYAMSPRPVHASVIWTSDVWTDKANQLPSNPMGAGITNPGPLVFDVAEDATGLQLTMDGIDGSIELGF
ncbi:MAG: hypothetical protein AAF702_34680 [Chloroflexota bacterium]